MSHYLPAQTHVQTLVQTLVQTHVYTGRLQPAVGVCGRDDLWLPITSYTFKMSYSIVTFHSRGVPLYILPCLILRICDCLQLIRFSAEIISDLLCCPYLSYIHVTFARTLLQIIQKMSAYISWRESSSVQPCFALCVTHSVVPYGTAVCLAVVLCPDIPIEYWACHKHNC